jgi:galactonate dehydratase
VKIVAIEPYVVDVEVRNLVFVHVRTDEGLDGIGEASLPGHPLAVAAAVKECADWLLGEDAARIQHLWQIAYRRPFFRGGPVQMSAISGIEQALWDIKGKAAGLPVYELLGGACRERVRLYANGPGGATPEEVADSGRALRELGFGAMKLGGAEPFLPVQGETVIRQAAETVAALREAVGDDVEIAYDAHGRPTPAMGIRLAHALEEYGIWFLEEPAPPESVEALAAVARATRIPVAAGERLLTKWGFRPLLEAGATALVQPDTAHCGGILEARLIAAMAEAYHVGLAPHNPLGPVNTVASAHLALAAPNFVALELLVGYYPDWTRELVRDPPRIADGFLELGREPGLGIELDLDLCRRHPYQPRPLPLLRHEDGAVADW